MNEFSTENKVKEYIRNQEEESQMGQETAARFTEGKNRHDLIPSSPIDELARVYTYGCQKYDSDNWRKGLKWRKDVIGPLKRHLEKWIRGEKIDKESGCYHLAMTLWNVCALMEYERTNTGIDDRNPYDLSMMDENERNRRIEMWLKHSHENNLDNYNGLKKE